MKIELEGFDELEQKLLQMGKEAGQSIDKATSTGAWYVRGRQEAQAPEKNVTTVVKESSDEHSAVYLIGLIPAKWFLRFFEYGAQPHEITGAPLKFFGNFGFIQAPKVNHPGMAAQPFVKPSLNRTNSANVSERMKDVFIGFLKRFTI